MISGGCSSRSPASGVSAASGVGVGGGGGGGVLSCPWWCWLRWCSLSD